MKIYRTQALALVFLAAGAAAQTPSYNPDMPCSGSLGTALVRATMVGTCEAATGTSCIYGPYTFTMSDIGCGDFDDADAYISGYALDSKYTATTVRGQNVGFTTSFNPGTQVLTYYVIIGFAQGPGGTFTDFNLTYELIATKNDYSRLLRKTLTCTASADKCTASGSDPGVVPSGFEVVGSIMSTVAITGRAGG